MSFFSTCYWAKQNWGTIFARYKCEWARTKTMVTKLKNQRWIIWIKKSGLRRPIFTKIFHEHVIMLTLRKFGDCAHCLQRNGRSIFGGRSINHFESLFTMGFTKKLVNPAAVLFERSFGVRFNVGNICCRHFVFARGELLEKEAVNELTRSNTKMSQQSHLEQAWLPCQTILIESHDPFQNWVGEIQRPSATHLS